MEFLNCDNSPLPLFLLTTALTLYTSVRIFGGYHGRLASIPVNSPADIRDAERKDGPNFKDTEPEHRDKTFSENNTAHDAYRNFQSLETNFADVEVDSRRLYSSTIIPPHVSSQEIPEGGKAEPLLMFSEIDQRLHQPQFQVNVSLHASLHAELKIPDDWSEINRPCTPCMGISTFSCSPDSGYHSDASPQSVLGTKSNTSHTSVDSQWDDDSDLQAESVHFDSSSPDPASHVKDRKRKYDAGVRPIELCWVMKARNSRIPNDLGIMILNHDSGVHVPLRTALATTTLRKSTGLLLSLYYQAEGRELRVREAINPTRERYGGVNMIQAVMMVRDRVDGTLKDLETMLRSPDMRLRAGLRIERGRQSVTEEFPLPEKPMAWKNFVTFLDVDGYFLNQLRVAATHESRGQPWACEFQETLNDRDHIDGIAF